MRCPHCDAELLYRQRGGRRCAACKQKFAFEPKTDPLRMHDNRFNLLVNKLSENGTLRYTANQLHYAVSRKAIRDQRHQPVVNLVVELAKAFGIAFVMYLISTLIFSTIVSFLIAVFIAIIGVPFAAWRAYMPPKMPISMPDFNRRIIQQWKKVYGHPPRGLIDEQTRQQAANAMPAPRHMQAVVVCPQRDVCVSLLASGIAERLQVGVLAAQPPFTPTEEAVLTMLRSSPRVPLLLLHDASVEGCLLPHMIQRRLGLKPDHRVNDLGLRPAQVMSHGMMQRKTNPNAKLLRELQKRTAPAGTPRDADIVRQGYLVTREEFEWLKQGNYSPILAVGPARLIRVVTRDVQRLNQSSMTVAATFSADPEEQAQEKARAVGFMTWPST